MYMLVQVLGGVVAAMTYSLIYAPSSRNTFPLGPQQGHHMYQVAVAEIVFSFVLCYVVLCTAVVRKTRTDMCGLANSCSGARKYMVIMFWGGAPHALPDSPCPLTPITIFVSLLAFLSLGQLEADKQCREMWVRGPGAHFMSMEGSGGPRGAPPPEQLNRICSGC